MTDRLNDAPDDELTDEEIAAANLAAEAEVEEDAAGGDTIAQSEAIDEELDEAEAEDLEGYADDLEEAVDGEDEAQRSSQGCSGRCRARVARRARREGTPADADRVPDRPGAPDQGPGLAGLRHRLGRFLRPGVPLRDGLRQGRRVHAGPHADPDRDAQHPPDGRPELLTERSPGARMLGQACGSASDDELRNDRVR